MQDIVGVRFRRLGKIYFFDPKYLNLKKGDNVIVETSEGEEFGTVMIPNRPMDESKIVTPLKKVLRIVNNRDKKHYEECKELEKKAMDYCNKKIQEFNLEMNLTDVECKFDNTKLLFYFTADGRIDFRDLVKELALEFKTRIELRQIGVRDEIKKFGGNGICGRELCCCSFLSDFETVSIKMAKDQSLSLNPTKISGNCGRLMCCLKYEQEVYEDKLSRVPHVGAIVKSVDGTGEVDMVETLAERVRVKFKNGEGYTYKKYNLKEIQIIKDNVKESYNEEETVNQKELAELEELEKKDSKDKKGGDKYGI